METQRVKAQVLAAVKNAAGARVQPYELVRSISQSLQVSRAVVSRALTELVEERQLMFLCRGDPFSELVVAVPSGGWLQSHPE
jgi:hypothetical protein